MYYTSILRKNYLRLELEGQQKMTSRCGGR